MKQEWIATSGHSLDDARYIQQCRQTLETRGALVLKNFFTDDAVSEVIRQSKDDEENAFYARSKHNVYLNAVDPELPQGHAHNRQIVSSKGLIADDQIPENSPLRSLYNDQRFRGFLCGVLGIDQIYSYADELSSVNVHFASAGQELGWHFDNSAFAVTMLLQAPEAGGVFEYVPEVRDTGVGDMAYDRVNGILDGKETVKTLDFAPGDLVLFKGRNAMHRVTPTQGDTTRMLVVFAFNEQPNIKLSASALMTFYGRTS